VTCPSLYVSARTAGCKGQLLNKTAIVLVNIAHQLKERTLRLVESTIDIVKDFKYGRDVATDAPDAPDAGLHETFSPEVKVVRCLPTSDRTALLALCGHVRCCSCRVRPLFKTLTCSSPITCPPQHGLHNSAVKCLRITSLSRERFTLPWPQGTMN
jgi:hypothetical protein